MDILQDSWFTVNKLHRIHMRLVNMEPVFIHYKTSVFNFNYKKMFPYKKTPFTFYPTFKGSKTPHQNSAEAKKLNEGGLPLKARLVRANNQLIKVSIYIFYLQSLLKPYLLVQMYAFDFYLQQIY